MKIKIGFDELKRQQTKNVAISLFNLRRYLEMDDKEIFREIGGDRFKIKLKGKKLREYVEGKEKKDIENALSNIKLLNELQKEHGDGDVMSITKWAK